MEQCKLLGISRSSFYYKPQNAQEEQEIRDLQLIVNFHEIDPHVTAMLTPWNSVS